MKMILKKCIAAIIAMMLLSGNAFAFEDSADLEPKYIQCTYIADEWYGIPEGRGTIAFYSMMEFAFGTDADFDSIDLYGDTFTGKNDGTYITAFRYIDNAMNPWIIVFYNQDVGFLHYEVLTSDEYEITPELLFSVIEAQTSDGIFRNEKEDIRSCYEDFKTVIELERMYPYK